MRSSILFIAQFLSLTVLLTTVASTLLAKDFLVEEDLRLDWVFYDESQNVMLPYLDNSNEYPVAIHLLIDKEYGESSYLMVDVPSDVSLFLEGKFISTFGKPTSRLFSIDSIKNHLDISSFQFTLYKKTSFQRPIETKIGFLHNSFDSAINVNPVLYRDSDSKLDFLKLIILIIFAFFVVLYSLFRSDLLDFFSLPTLFTFRLTETAFLKYRSLTKTQTMVIIFQAALLGGILITYLYYYNNPFGESFLAQSNPILVWIMVFGLVLLFIFLKFLLISIVSALFKVSESTNFYFIEFLRMAMIFYSAVYVVICFTLINHFYFVDTLLEKLILVIAIFYVIRFLILYFKFRRTVSMKNLHLFSYLCTTELIPIILGLKFFIK